MSPVEQLKRLHERRRSEDKRARTDKWVKNGINKLEGLAIPGPLSLIVISTCPFFTVHAIITSGFGVPAVCL